jgi:glycosyltransferase involved in cell wall biosynthesis
MKPLLPTVTVIMPVFNEADLIEKSLGAVLTQDYPRELIEILVIDGGSTDKTCEIIRCLIQNHPSAKLLSNPKKIQSAGLNIGIREAQGDIIVRVDGHTIIAPDYVRMCVHHLMHAGADNVGGLMRPAGATYVGKAIALATTTPFGIGDSKFHYLEHEEFVDTVYLGAFWRGLFDQVGLFDETLTRNQDYELNIRIRKAGGKILLSPKIISSYTPRSSLTALWRQYFQYGYWKVRTLHKHPDSLRWRQAVPPLFVLAFLNSLLLSLTWKPCRWLFALLAGSYLLANSVASTIAAKRSGWRYLPIMPMVFACIHFAWGIGFWWGLIKLWKKIYFSNRR